MSEVRKEYNLDEEDAAELFRDIADALEGKDQLNIELGEEKLIQPLGEKVPLRIFQDEEGTEIGFKLQN